MTHTQEPHSDAPSSLIKENQASSVFKGSLRLNEEQGESRTEVSQVTQEPHAGIDGNESAEEQSSGFVVSEIPAIQRTELQKKSVQWQMQRAVTSMPTRAPTTKSSNQVK